MRLVLIVLLFVVSTGAQAASLRVDANGQLIGATGVNVSGTLYNVEFLDGSCIEVFYGCDEQSDFAFSTISDAENGLRALLDQVLVDLPGVGLFDMEPSLTRGCPDMFICFISIPYASSLELSRGFFSVSAHRNGTGVDVPAFTDFTYGRDEALGDGPFARWTPASAVPIPAALPLFLSALAGLGVMRRRKLKVQLAA